LVIVDVCSDEQSAGPFVDLDAYVNLPRVGGLWLSPDGSRLVVAVATPDRKKVRYTTALWEIDPAGERAARRITRSDDGESVAAFTPAGDLLFTSARPDQDGEADGAAGEEPRAALWLQPATGGDARVLASLPGGVRGVSVSESGVIVLGSPMLPSSGGADSDKEIRNARKEAGVSAILHEEYPVRYWDRDLGPHRTRLLVAALTEDVTGADAPLDLRDLTGHVGRALGVEDGWDIAPDGRTVVAVWTVAESAGSQRSTLVAIDVATGERRTLVDSADLEYGAPRVSPDGTRVAVVVERRSSPEEPGDVWLAVVPLTGGPVQALTDGWDRWPHSARWTPDSAAMIVAADESGRSPLWRVDATTGGIARLTSDDGAYTDIRVSPDGRWVYALRSAVDSPPRPIRVALDGGSDGGSEVQVLPGPAEVLGACVRVPGTLAEVTTTAADGTPLRAWIAVPSQAGTESPAPLLVWIHGGPLSSWNAWSWRWNPWIAVARGYAVLLPDPALSTGYGHEFLKRGWGDWGGAPYTDLMAITDAAEKRPDIDAGRTAAMGGSFGGYMANWVAGHTDRFAAIVTHASVWDRNASIESNDVSYAFRRSLSYEAADALSPHHFADAISTPMLVTHGGNDYRVPVSEGMKLWWALSSRAKGGDRSSPHKFLYFPDEGHWILKPGNVKAWYATVLAFLDHHVRGQEWQRPDLLG
jgi:dipeptidyl aminopeptidase/acylaminoacyl peptidase